MRVGQEAIALATAESTGCQDMPEMKETPVKNGSNKCWKKVPDGFSSRVNFPAECDSYTKYSFPKYSKIYCDNLNQQLLFYNCSIFQFYIQLISIYLVGLINYLNRIVERICKNKKENYSFIIFLKSNNELKLSKMYVEISHSFGVHEMQIFPYYTC